MKDELSILIPTYNDDCYELVASLQAQADAIDGLKYEILVSDDASSSTRIIMNNRRINDLPHSRFIENAVNRGRSGNRNALMKEAQYAWLLFVDARRSIVRDDFLQKYLSTADDERAIYGAYIVVGDEHDLKGNLRFLYERQLVSRHAVEKRRLIPEMDFNASNFFIEKKLMEEHPFDERFSMYGYEDVIFGKELTQSGTTITHIDNPVGFSRFEDNATFVKKTEAAMQTLYEFREALLPYSRLLQFYKDHSRITSFVLWLYHRNRKSWKHNLHSDKPSLKKLQLYKLGYYATIVKKAAGKNIDKTSKDYNLPNG